MTPEEAVRYVLAEDAESGETRCFAALPGRVEVVKFGRKKSYYYHPRFSLKRIYTSDGGGDWGFLMDSPFWLNPRLVKLNEIPAGVHIP